MNKTINYQIEIAKFLEKKLFSYDGIVSKLGIDSQTARTLLGDQKPIRIICLEGTNKATVNDYVLYDELVKLIAFANKVNPEDIKLYSSDIPLGNIEKDQLTAVISVEPPSEGNGQTSDVTVFADNVYSTMDIAKEYRIDICVLNQYLEYRNVQYFKKNKYHLCGRLRGKGLIVDMPTLKYLRWSEKGRKFVEFMLEHDGYKKVMRKHG